MSLRDRVNTLATDGAAYVDTKTGEMLDMPPDGADTLSYYAGIFIRERAAEDQAGTRAVMAQDAYLSLNHDKRVQFPEHGCALQVVEAMRAVQDVKAIHEWVDGAELSVEELRLLVFAAKGFTATDLPKHLKDAIEKHTSKVANKAYLKREPLEVKA